MDPIVAHALGAVPDIQKQRQVDAALDNLLQEDQMRKFAEAANAGDGEKIPLLTEGIASGALDNELDELETAILARRNVLNKVLICTNCGEEGAEDPWDCPTCIDNGSRACVYPERPTQEEMKQIALWRYETEEDRVAAQLAALKRELGVSE
jgi:hypothetical protein